MHVENIGRGPHRITNLPVYSFEEEEERAEAMARTRIYIVNDVYTWTMRERSTRPGESDACR